MTNNSTNVLNATYQLTVKDLHFYGRPMSQTNKAKICKILAKSPATHIFNRLFSTSTRIDNITAYFTTEQSARAAAFDIETQVGMCIGVVTEQAS
jgi:hypothetical protein